MSGIRPKRKATVNKSYNDTLEEINEDDGIVIPASILKKKSGKKIDLSKANSNSNSKILIPYNWQPKPKHDDFFSNKLDLSDAYVDISTQTLYCPNYPHTRSSSSKKSCFYLTKGDYIYMISEPPGEPYYVGRIMGFTAKKNHNLVQDQNGPIFDANDYMFQIQWFYRPRDISKSTTDSRLLFASMHTDTCPFISYRGLITVRHKQDIENDYNKLKFDNTSIKDGKSQGKKSSSPINSINALENYSLKPNCFYFDKLFDRYMIKFYEILSTQDLLKYGDSPSSKSKSFLLALNKRFEFIFVESQRTKSLISSFGSSSRNCKKCDLWCDSPQDTINCVVCHKYYHMYCLDPPLLKKPSRGFSWACAVCTKEQDLAYQNKRLVMLSHDNKSSNEKEITSGLSELSSPIKDDTFSITSANQSTSSSQDEGEEEDEEDSQPLPTYEIMASEFLKNDSNLTLEQRRLKEEWPMRYLGMHSRLEDGVDLEDRNPYPRASTRLGAKHQATNIPECDGHPIVYYDPEKGNLRKKPGMPPKKRKNTDDDSLKKLEVPKEYADLSAKEYPSWLQPRPKGYIERGVDDGDGITNTLLWKPSEADEKDNFAKLDLYIEKCNPIAEKLKLSPNSPNFVDYILLMYITHDGDIDKAYEVVSKVSKKILREPVFNKEEVKRFENGVRKYGSELHPVQKLVKSQSSAMVVRFYYLWKKTKNGKLIWGNFEGRRHKKLQNLMKDEAKTDTSAVIPAIDILADPDDDSSYEDEKIIEHKSKFICKHCDSHKSTKWFRITGHDANSDEKLENGGGLNRIVALCFRCARLWRRYAVEWESPDEVEKKTTKVTGWKKKVEAELMRDAEAILEEAATRGGIVSYNITSDSPPSIEEMSIETETSLEPEPESEPAKKGKPGRKLKKETETFDLRADSKKPASIEPKPTKAKEMKVKEMKPKEVKPKEVKNKEVKPKEVKPKEMKPKEVKPKEVKPKEVKPKEVKPKEAKPKEVKSKEVRGKEAKIEKLKVQRVAPAKPRSSKVANQVSKLMKDEIKIDASSKVKEKTAPRKRKIKEDAKNPKIKQDEDKTSNEPPTKKQKKTPSLESLIDQLKNSNYITPTSVEKSYVINNEMHEPSNGVEKPQLLFPVDSRPCSVCFTDDGKLSDMLICSHCGVNVHGSCAGISIPDKIMHPITEWLCEVCVNDMKQIYSQDYSCELCFAKFSNIELNRSGSNEVRPNYLKPIYDSGKWCHLICAAFNSNLIGFRPYVTGNIPKKLTKDDYLNNKVDLINKTIGIESVSKVYFSNFDKKCQVCKNYNGSLIKCDECDYTAHITCAQDSNNLKLGFKLDENYENKSVKIDEKIGVIKPILLCFNHLQSSIFSFQTLGKRVNQKEEAKPIIQIFLEEIVKLSSSIKVNGPYLKSLQYMDSTNTKVTKFDLDNETTCNRCETTSSPIWWDELNETGNKICQRCYHLPDDYDNEIISKESSPCEDFLDLLNKPLNGSFYGIIDENDHVIIKPDNSNSDTGQLNTVNGSEVVGSDVNGGGFSGVKAVGSDLKGGDADGRDASKIGVCGSDVNENANRNNANVINPNENNDRIGVNGTNVNVNGTDINGTDVNGTDVNGTDANGTDANGTDLNGTDVNGTDANETDLDESNQSISTLESRSKISLGDILS